MDLDELERQINNGELVPRQALALVARIRELEAQVEAQRQMFDSTRHRVLERMGESDMGKSWNWIEGELAEYRKARHGQ